MLKKSFLSFLVVFMFLASLNAESPAVRLKDIAELEGIRNNQLMGVGLVVGLKGTGDSSMAFTGKALTNLITNMGGSPQKDIYKSKNVAAVMVTAELLPFTKPGQKLDVVVSSIGEATSLKDGTLLMTPLKGSDEKVYAVAQGQVVFGGRTDVKNKKNETVCKVVDGAIIEKAVPMDFIEKDTIKLLLKKADFTTATRVAYSLDRGGFSGAKATDPSTIEVPLTSEDKENIVMFVSKLEDFMVIPDSIAKVVINQRTGTVVIGENVRLAPVAISHGDVEIKIDKTAGDVSENETLLTDVPAEDVGVDGEATAESAKVTKQLNIKLVQLKAGTSLSSLVKALNSVGTSPQDLVAILQALKAAGSLSAELEVI